MELTSRGDDFERGRESLTSPSGRSVREYSYTGMKNRRRGCIELVRRA